MQPKEQSLAGTQGIRSIGIVSLGFVNGKSKPLSDFSKLFVCFSWNIFFLFAGIEINGFALHLRILPNI